MTEQQPAAKRESFISTLQALRFLAASMVLFSHLKIESGERGDVYVKDFTAIPWFTGVDLFFIVSGFIIYLLSHDKFGRPGYVSTFIRNRVIRVVPIYWICTSAYFAAVMLAGNMVNTGHPITVARLIGNYLFLPMPRDDGTFFPIFVLGWTLNFEMFFYAVFAAALPFARRTALILIVGLLLGLATIGFVFRPQIPFAIFYTRPIIIEFLFGILLAHFYIKGVRLPIPLRAILILGGLLGLGLVGHLIDEPGIYTRFLWAGVPCLMIATGGVLGSDIPADKWWARILIEGGSAAYSLYLTHMFTIRLLTMAWTKAGLPFGWPYVIVGLVAAMGVAVATFRLLEAPLISFLRSKIGSRSPKTPVQPQRV